MGEQVVKEEIAERVKDFEGTTNEWEHKPRFESKVEVQGNKVTGEISTDDLIYHYLDKGTAHRHAKMSNPYERHTQPRSLKSGPGSGKKVWVSKQFEGISPDTGQKGITAREWSVLIRNRAAISLHKRLIAHLKASKGRISRG